MSRKTDLTSLIFMVAIFLMGAVALAAQIDGIGKNPGNGNGQGQGGGERHEKKRIVHGKVKDKHALDLLMDDSDGDVEVEMGKESVHKVRGRFKIDRSKTVEDATLDFIDRHRNAFGLKNPRAELKLSRKDSTCKFKQTFNNIPIENGGIIIGYDQEGNINYVSSIIMPIPTIDTTPLVSKEEAEDIALSYCTAKTKKSRDYLRIIEEFPTKLIIVHNRLIYIVTVFVGFPRWEISVDAKTGEALSFEDLTNY